MDGFNEKFYDALKTIGSKIVSDDGKEVSKSDFVRTMNEKSVYEIDGTWYTYGSIHLFGKMSDFYAKRYKGHFIFADEITFYMLNDCNVSGLCIVLAEGRYGIFPLNERTGSQSGIWCCKGYPFLYDDVKVYADWEKWDDYGYVAIEKDGKWGAIKVTQFPEPSVEQVADFVFCSPEEAMKGAGLTWLPDREPYFHRV